MSTVEFTECALSNSAQVAIAKHISNGYPFVKSHSIITIFPTSIRHTKMIHLTDPIGESSSYDIVGIWEVKFECGDDKEYCYKIQARLIRSTGDWQYFVINEQVN